MCKSKIKPNVESYNSLLLATSQMGNLDVTIAVLELMDKHGIAKNFYSYQRMIQCIRKTLKTPNLSLEGRDTTKQERIDMAVQLFSEMNDKDLCDDRRKAEIITKEIFLVYQNSFALKRCLAFVENLNEDDNAELYQELCLRAFRLFVKVLGKR
ncbi:hypothetical protein MHBO_003749 [Bonamia ostreae]|uniref:Pentatricopeptide repeat-containing protein n=1 Tax=Bonamia ostreae TaxID=126728 RepID=A0ABV2ARG5_9EUKA